MAPVETRHLSVGDVGEVVLPGPATTGARWELEAADSGVEVLDASLAEREYARVGGTNVWRFLFRAVAPGQARLRFQFRRPWEDHPLDAREVDLSIDSA